MKVCVGIPSYNEADRISFVASQVDKGLLLSRTQFPQIEDAIILNADSDSGDNTVAKFTGTLTTSPKDVIVTRGDPGKGKNILAIFKYAMDHSFDAVFTVDADLESITPDWIVRFSELIIGRGADFVYPEYKRNRFEGSTTNHFAYPLLYAYFGKDMRQPIGGDFAMSINYVSHILNQDIPSGAHKYGIDIFLSMNAVVGSFLIDSAHLGQKIHKPSFSRMRDMFPQIAATAVDTIRKHGRAQTFEAIDNGAVNIIDQTEFTHSIEAGLIRDEELEKLHTMLNGQISWLDKKLGKELKSLFKIHYQNFDAKYWIVVLGAWVTYVLKNPEVESNQYVNELLPFFVLRAVNFWNESEVKSASWVEAGVRQQATELKKYLDTH